MENAKWYFDFEDTKRVWCGDWSILDEYGILEANYIHPDILKKRKKKYRSIDDISEIES